MPWLLTQNCECTKCGKDPCDTEACLCLLNLDTAGGDEGFSQTYDVSGEFVSNRDIYIDFESYTVKDQLVIYAGSSIVYDSGCIGAHVTPTVTIPGGTTSVTVIVYANCEGTTGTAWTLSITCQTI
jgi:hypothetical protein